MNRAATLPSAPESEAETVGACLIDPAQLARVATMLRPGDYADPAHRAAIGALLAMHREQVPVDVLTLKARLERLPEFGKPGSAAVYLAEVGRGCVTAAHAAHHAAIVAETSLKRRLCLAAVDMAADARNGKPAGEVLANWGAVFEDLQRESNPKAKELEAYTLAEFLKLDHRQTFLIQDVVTEAQPGCVSAKSKSLKTTISGLAAMALASGQPFLGRYEVPEPQPCGIISAESGGATLAESFERLAASMGLFASDIERLHISTKMPLLTTGEGRDTLERFIVKYGLRALWVDPTYKAFPGVDDSQLSQMALHLFPLSDIIERTGCSIIMVHHNRKSPARQGDHYAEPTIDDILGTGYQQWARFFLLLNKRREWDANEGRHWLWFKTEGSAGFGSRQWLDVCEGRRCDPGGRTWQASLADPSEAAEQEREQAAASKDAAKLDGERRAVCNALARFPEGVSWSKALRLGNVSTRRWEVVKDCMIDEGDVVECEIAVSNHRTPQKGIKLASVEST